MPRCFTYKLFKENLDYEEYFNILEDRDVFTLCRFRTLNHSLPIENGRWFNIERGERKCNLCTRNDIGDEYHYIMECPKFAAERRLFLPKNLTVRPNVLKFGALFNSKKISVLKKLCKFIRHVNQTCSPPV